MSSRILAEEMGLPESTVSKWIGDGGWVDERKAVTARVTAEAIKANVAKRIRDLSDWNAGDLVLARAIRSQVSDHLVKAQDAKKRNPAISATISVKDLQILASIVETTQRIGRNALGVGDGGKIDESGLEEQVASITVRVKDGRVRAVAE
jgi:hypothetical protein